MKTKTEIIKNINGILVIKTVSEEIASAVKIGGVYSGKKDFFKKDQKLTVAKTGFYTVDAAEYEKTGLRYSVKYKTKKEAINQAENGW